MNGVNIHFPRLIRSGSATIGSGIGKISTNLYTLDWDEHIRKINKNRPRSIFPGSEYERYITSRSYCLDDDGLRLVNFHSSAAVEEWNSEYHDYMSIKTCLMPVAAHVRSFFLWLGDNAFSYELNGFDRSPKARILKYVLPWVFWQGQGLNDEQINDSTDIDKLGDQITKHLMSRYCPDMPYIEEARELIRTIREHKHTPVLRRIEDVV